RRCRGGGPGGPVLGPRGREPSLPGVPGALDAGVGAARGHGTRPAHLRGRGGVLHAALRAHPRVPCLPPRGSVPAEVPATSGLGGRARHRRLPGAARCAGGTGGPVRRPGAGAGGGRGGGTGCAPDRGCGARGGPGAGRGRAARIGRGAREPRRGRTMIHGAPRIPWGSTRWAAAAVPFLVSLAGGACGGDGNGAAPPWDDYLRVV